MTLFKINYRLRSIKDPFNYREIIENIVLDENTGKVFLKEFKKILKNLESLKIDNNIKIKKLKYFLKSYKLKDISNETKEIIIKAHRNIENKKGALKIITNFNSDLNHISNKDIFDKDSELNFDSKRIPLLIPEKMH